MLQVTALDVNLAVKQAFHVLYEQVNLFYCHMLVHTQLFHTYEERIYKFVCKCLISFF